MQAACSSEQPTAAPAYRTTQPSLLFFKNMRSSYYRATEEPESRIIYYHLNRWRSNAGPDQVWQVVIASDWLNDRAFLVPEWGENRPVRLTYIDDEGTEQELDLPRPAPSFQTDWLLALARLVEDGNEIIAHFPDDQSERLLADAASKACFLTVVKDYLRLTEQS